MKRTTLGVFLTLVFFTFFNNAIHWYTHFVTYPLQAYVGREEFLRYGAAYEAGLVWALYIPYCIMLLASLVLIWRRPAGVSRAAMAAAFGLNLSIVVVSFTLAVPLHQAHAALGQISPEGVEQLLQINLLRLGAASVSSIVVFRQLLKLLRPAPGTAGEWAGAVPAQGQSAHS